MKRLSLGILVAFLLSAYIYTPALAAKSGEEDTDARMVDARVVEVNDQHISVIAQTGVEHVIATDAAKTRVTLKGKRIAFKKLKVGDIVTIELDAVNPLKFARRIVVGEEAGSTLASVRD
jgi:hypothetical protein